jgi:DNA polymerase III sliding clamp (beta) subunit (PCNA family)
MVKNSVKFFLPTHKLAAMATALMPAVSKEETRYYLCGVALQNHPADKTQLVFIATDGHKLAKYTMPHEAGETLKVNCIMPAGAVKYLAGLKKQGDGLTMVEITDSWITISQTDSSKTFPLIDGNFPDWQRALPKKTKAPEVYFDSAYMTAILTACARTNKKLNPRSSRKLCIGLWLNASNPTESVFEIETGIEGLQYVLMPIRG